MLVFINVTLPPIIMVQSKGVSPTFGEYVNQNHGFFVVSRDLRVFVVV